MRWVLITLLILPGLIDAQTLSTSSKKAIAFYMEADNYRVRLQYEQAIQLLNEAINRDNDFEEAYYRRGIVYEAMRRYENAIRDYEKALALTKKPRNQRQCWYDLGRLYFATGKYDEARSVLNNFIASGETDEDKLDDAQRLLKSTDFAQSISDVDTGYRQKPLSDTVNAFFMQYFPVLTADQQDLIFTMRQGGGPDDDENLVISHKDSSGHWSVPVSLSRNINSRLNEGTCAISADGRKLIFTSCVGRESYGGCDLFESVKVGNEWSVPQNLGSNVNSYYWDTQPSLSADGRTLYFVSDRRGGVGGRDIWVSRLDDKGNWTKATNMGEPVNTTQDEISPFIHPNGRVLYFASNGQIGLGGYDIYYSERGDSAWEIPQNLGKPINTYEDQFSYFVTADGAKAYYSHEDLRTDGIPRGRLYEVLIPQDKRVRYKSNYVKGVVTDKETGSPLHARVELINLGTSATESIVSSDSVTGQYLITLAEGSGYALYVTRTGYLFRSLHFNYADDKDYEPIIVDIQLEKAREGSESVLNNIFFDFDKYELRPESRTELEKLARFLRENANLRIELSGHTDNVGSEEYNRGLSQKRCDAVVQYLTSQGLAGSRLVAVGRGSSQPVASNETEEGRQMNRRITFRVLRR